MSTSPDPLVSIIAPTYNHARLLEACLISLTAQTYKNIELIIVDDGSTDNSIEVANKFPTRVFARTHMERTVQRNYGVSQAKGDYICIIDIDMELSPKVIEACITLMQNDETLTGVIIPEESFGKGFWATCKRLERSFYVGIDELEAARFFTKAAFEQVGGYDEELISGEDWDLSRRIGAIGKLGRIDQFILHNEGQPRFFSSLRKKYYYAGHAAKYLAKQDSSAKLTANQGPLRRYKLFFSDPHSLFRNPLLGMGMLFMKTCEFAAGGAGYVIAKVKK